MVRVRFLALCGAVFLLVTAVSAWEYYYDFENAGRVVLEHLRDKYNTEDIYLNPEPDGHTEPFKYRAYGMVFNDSENNVEFYAYQDFRSREYWDLFYNSLAQNYFEGDLENSVKAVYGGDVFVSCHMTDEKYLCDAPFEYSEIINGSDRFLEYVKGRYKLKVTFLTAADGRIITEEDTAAVFNFIKENYSPCQIEIVRQKPVTDGETMNFETLISAELD